ncbi:hypothetical protein BCR43DRAFT_481447 [Syncephalastrum racemosum]|uniref:Uncharacterized protein n=1 Tax=Syncephalastrum racemosum TaxID=13706 RepID=A0A1X2HS59_SYNRA|nr:hypothetical protein BCR43DRAFT_481447 [Syncephalastrum racemosum]
MSKRLHREAFEGKSEKADMELVERAPPLTTRLIRPLRSMRTFVHNQWCLWRLDSFHNKDDNNKDHGQDGDDLDYGNCMPRHLRRGHAYDDMKNNNNNNIDAEDVHARPAKRQRSLASTCVDRVQRTFRYYLHPPSSQTTLAGTLSDAKTNPFAPPTTTQRSSHYPAAHRHNHTKRSRTAAALKARGFDFSTTSWSWNLRHVDSFVRRFCFLPPSGVNHFQHEQPKEDPEEDYSAFPPVARAAIRKAVSEDNEKWGLVNESSLDVHFFSPAIPPPKPMRTYAACPRMGYSPAHHPH